MRRANWEIFPTFQQMPFFCSAIISSLRRFTNQSTTSASSRGGFCDRRSSWLFSSFRYSIMTALEGNWFCEYHCSSLEISVSLFNSEAKRDDTNSESGLSSGLKDLLILLSSEECWVKSKLSLDLRAGTPNSRFFWYHRSNAIVIASGNTSLKVPEVNCFRVICKKSKCKQNLKFNYKNKIFYTHPIFWSRSIKTPFLHQCENTWLRSFLKDLTMSLAFL